MQNDTQQKQVSQPKGGVRKAGANGRPSSTNTSGHAASGGAVRSGQSGHAVESATYRRRNAAGSSSRPSGFTTAGSAGRTSPNSVKPAQRHTQIKRRPYNKRRRRKPFPWRQVLIGAGAALAIALIIAIIVNATHATHHLLPKVTRIEDYTPEPLSPEASAAVSPEAGSAEEDEADFPAGADIPAQDEDAADTIAWNGTTRIVASRLPDAGSGFCRRMGRAPDEAAGADPPCPPCEGGLLELRHCEEGLMEPGAASIYYLTLAVIPRETGSGLRAASIYQHPSTATLPEAMAA